MVASGQEAEANPGEFISSRDAIAETKSSRPAADNG
jgi:hypothetical protein